MEQLTVFDRQIVDLFIDCYNFAKQFINFPKDLQFGIAGYETGLFDHPNVPGITTEDGSKIVFNRKWLARSFPDHMDDIRFFMFHELRHAYQKNQLALQAKQEPTQEETDVISRWEYEFNHYITNTGDELSQKGNLAQEIEQDANGYGMALVYLYNIDQGAGIECSLPEPAFSAADQRANEYIRMRPELKSYIENWKRENTRMSLNRIHPSPYDPCPCGSGKKYKFCCYKKGIDAKMR